MEWGEVIKENKVKYNLFFNFEYKTESEIK